MRPTSPDTRIPTYELEPAAAGKPRFIRVEEVDRLSFRLRPTFLVPHRKNFFLLVYARYGAGRHWIDMAPYEYRPDAIYLTTPEQVHLKEDVVITGTIVSFTPEFLALKENQGLSSLPLLQNLQRVHELPLSPAEQQEVEEILAKLVAEYQQAAPWQDDMLYAYTRVLLLRLSRIYHAQYPELPAGPGPQDRELHRRFQACLDEHYATAHEVQAYAELLHLSASHLNALIKEQTGQTALWHIHQRLVLEAKRRLFTTECSVKQLAFELGFQDDSYFNRFFKRLTGSTPTAYRAEVAGLKGKSAGTGGAS